MQLIIFFEDLYGQNITLKPQNLVAKEKLLLFCLFQSKSIIGMLAIMLRPATGGPSIHFPNIVALGNR
jgi:hypothetical protein